MKIKYLIYTLCLCALWGWAAQTARAAPSDESDVRNVVNQVFSDLKAGNYSQLYDTLPDAVQKKIARDKFTNALTRSRDSYELDRMEVGAVRVKGDLAVADTTLYGRVKKPLNGEGKIVAQQYLVREGGRWRVATGDNATINRFLKANPTFAKQFPVRQPRIYFKDDKGKWIDLSVLARQRRGK